MWFIRSDGVRRPGCDGNRFRVAASTDPRTPSQQNTICSLHASSCRHAAPGCVAPDPWPCRAWPAPHAPACTKGGEMGGRCRGGCCGVGGVTNGCQKEGLQQDAAAASCHAAAARPCCSRRHKETTGPPFGLIGELLAGLGDALGLLNNLQPGAGRQGSTGQGGCAAQGRKGVQYISRGILERALTQSRGQRGGVYFTV